MSKTSKSKLDKGDHREGQNLSDYWRERTIFPGSVPKEIRILVKSISSYDKTSFRKLIKAALGYLQDTYTPESNEAAFENLCKIRGCETEQDVNEFASQYSGMISLMRGVLKVNLKTVREDTLMHDLKELGFPDGFAADVCKVAFGPTHADIMELVIADNPSLPKLDRFQWQVDVTLSNNFCAKILEPHLTANLTTTDGETHSFHIPIASFHLLRQSTAALLRHMEALERRK